MRYHEIIGLIETKPTAPKAAVIKPTPPMSPAESYRKAEKRKKVQQRICDTQATYTKRLQDLRSSLITDR
jgi:hypothetical protein